MLCIYWPPRGRKLRHEAMTAISSLLQGNQVNAKNHIHQDINHCCLGAWRNRETRCHTPQLDQTQRSFPQTYVFSRSNFLVLINSLPSLQVFLSSPLPAPAQCQRKCATGWWGHCAMPTSTALVGFTNSSCHQIVAICFNTLLGSSNWFMPNRSTWCRKDKTTIFVSTRGLVFAAHTMALSLSIGRATLEGTGVKSYRIWRPLNDTSAGHALGSPRPVPLKESARAPSGTGKPYLQHLASSCILYQSTMQK